ncbi:unnamed protein product [Brassicogethes aeneus]|uniref:C2H2-type domain-containing protein n=1 Tax=Brassicogethes aeneus TaxID=1431903 RepID=A0A9P0AVE1_BRAAE|nr:unnamed protein product [Brassicogethes aeneus]
MEEKKVNLIEDFVTNDSIYIIDSKDVKRENQSLLDDLVTFEKVQSSVVQKNTEEGNHNEEHRNDCWVGRETSNTRISNDFIELSDSDGGSGRYQGNTDIKEEEEEEKHCLDDFYVETEFEINNTDEDCDNSDDGGKIEDFSCNIKEEKRGGDFSEEDDKILSHNEDDEGKNEGEGTFETKIEVEYHGVQNEDMTGKENLFKCNVCPKQYQTKESLLYHKKYTHRKFKCDKCDYETVDNSNLKKHSKIHDKSKYFKCKFCAYIAAELKCLNCHILTKHKSENKGENKIKITNKIYQCPKCPHSTVIKTSHDQHIKVCLNLKNVQWYKCEFCPYKNVTKNYTERHMKTHKKIQDFKCLFCKYQSITKQGVDSHMLSKHPHLLNESNTNLITVNTKMHI